MPSAEAAALHLLQPGVCTVPRREVLGGCFIVISKGRRLLLLLLLLLLLMLLLLLLLRLVTCHRHRRWDNECRSFIAAGNIKT